MTVREFLNCFDYGNNPYIVINSDNLTLLLSQRVNDISDDNVLLDETIRCWGLYDGDVCIRICK